MMDARYNIPLFADLPAAEFQWIRDNSRDIRLEAGQYFFKENEPAVEFYIVLDGELQVIRTINGKAQVMGTTPRGIIGGEVALLTSTPSQVSACALVPSHLMVLGQRAFRELFTFAPTVGARVLQIAAGRMQGFVTNLAQQEKMAALGRLSAGLAHELKNPAAATNQAALNLREKLIALQTQALRLSALGLHAEQIEHLITFQQQALTSAAEATPLSPLEQSDREDELSDWLDAQEIDQGWEMAPCFVGSAISKDDLNTLATALPPGNLQEVLAWLYQSLDAASLLKEIEQGTRRITDLVLAIKAYTYKDQAEAQEVDIHKGLESTLTVLGYKLKQGNIHIVREYDPALPRIQARGGALNQVWTNLVDNAIDALAGAGTIWLITRHEHTFVMVEVADNGPGISPEVQPRLFEPFFTTKEAGKGTGMGLDISYRIIQEHHGSIEVQSQPGHTRFIVRLPLSPNEA